METINNIPEGGGRMGYILAKKVAEKAAKIALSLGEMDEAVIIPDTDGQVLVRQGTSAFQKRLEDRQILKIPVVLKTVKGGVEAEDTFFVCTM